MAENTAEDMGGERRRGRGFAGMDPEKQREIARKGGEAGPREQNLQGVDRRQAGRLGGVAVVQKYGASHMAEIGRRGGQRRRRNREGMEGTRPPPKTAGERSGDTRTTHQGEAGGNTDEAGSGGTGHDDATNAQEERQNAPRGAFTQPTGSSTGQGGPSDGQP